MSRRILIAALLCLSLSAGAQSKSKVVTDTLFSRILGVERACTVILPPGYKDNPERRYPILYLLHGMYQEHGDWVEEAEVQRISAQLFLAGAATPMIVVTPDAGGTDPVTQQNGYFDLPDWAYEQFFFSEFLPFIETRYRVRSDREHRAIAGLSMGGGGAVSYAQRHPDIFCAAYAMSAWVALTDPQNRDYGTTKGKITPLHESVRRLDCIKYVENADQTTVAALKSVRWFIDCGDDDFLLDRNYEFFQAMREKGIPCQLRVRDGAHRWEYWRTAIPIFLPWFTAAFAEADLK